MQQENELLEEVSVYWREIWKYIDERIKKLCIRKEDFLREHPPTDEPYFFFWQVDYIEELVEKTAEKSREEGIEQGRQVKQRETILRILTHRFDIDDNMIARISEKVHIDRRRKHFRWIRRCRLERT